jgi:hypothetical protein
MADFLSRLAARTLGAAPIARPSIASMYAPEPTRAVNYAFDTALDAESADDSASHPFTAAPPAKPPLSLPPSFVEQDNTAPSAPVGQSLRSRGDAGGIPLESSEPTSRLALTVRGRSNAKGIQEDSHGVSLENTDNDASYTPLARTRIAQTSHNLPEADAPGTHQFTASRNEMESFTKPAFTPESPPAFSVNMPVSHTNQRQMRRGMVQNGSRTTKTLSEPPAGVVDVPRMQVSNHSSRRDDGLVNNVEALQSGNLVPEKTSNIVDALPTVTSSTFATPSRAGVAEINPSIDEISPRSVKVHSEQSVEARFAAPSHEYTDFVEPAPTIQVTIGRIEVRATPPPPAQPQSQQRPAPSIMSLDQYLQQRSKGGDR